MSDLKKIITRKALREEAGTTYFGRGLDYFQSGCVKKLEVHGNRIEGSVRGSRLYHCSIECDIDTDSLFGECSCPLGDDGEFCKHLVALGLAFINGFETPAPSRKQPDFKLAKFLQERSREELIALLNGAAKQYPDLLEYFRMSYLPEASEALRKELMQKIDRLLELAEECDYEDCYDDDEQYEIEQDEECLRQELKQLTDTMERMFSGTHTALVMELAEYAIEEAIRRDLQSEDACAGLISEMLSFYFKAVKKGLGKATDIAENMIEWEPLDSWGAMSQVGQYFMEAPARIEKAWNTAALRLWREMPVLGMTDQRTTSTQRAIMEKRLLQYARFNSDSELELEILQHNQSMEEHVLALGKLLIRLNRREELWIISARRSAIFHTVAIFDKAWSRNWFMPKSIPKPWKSRGGISRKIRTIPAAINFCVPPPVPAARARNSSKRPLRMLKHILKKIGMESAAVPLGSIF